MDYSKCYCFGITENYCYIVNLETMQIKFIRLDICKMSKIAGFDETSDIKIGNFSAVVNKTKFYTLFAKITRPSKQMSINSYKRTKFVLKNVLELVNAGNVYNLHEEVFVVPFDKFKDCEALPYLLPHILLSGGIDKIYDALCFALTSLYSIQDLNDWTDLGLSEGMI